MLIVHRPEISSGDRVLTKTMIWRRVPASRGSFDLPLTVQLGRFEVEVWNYKEGDDAEHATLPGLAAPLEHGWRYVYRFQGLVAAGSLTP